jgi:hypothetical protein
MHPVLVVPLPLVGLFLVRHPALHPDPPDNSRARDRHGRGRVLKVAEIAEIVLPSRGIIARHSGRGDGEGHRCAIVDICCGLRLKLHGGCGLEFSLAEIAPVILLLFRVVVLRVVPVLCGRVNGGCRCGG